MYRDHHSLHLVRAQRKFVSYGSAFAVLAFSIQMLTCCSSCASESNGQLSESAEVAADSLPARSFETLASTLHRTTRISAFRFNKPCFECRTSSLTANEVLHLVTPHELPPEQTERVRDRLSNKTLLSLGVAKACPSFAPASGFVLHEVNKDSVLLIYPDCKTARLVLDDGAQPYVFNLDLIYRDLMPALANGPADDIRR